MTALKKLYIKTYGCQMNVYDSDKMVDNLRLSGFETSDTMEGSDLVILNTCHIREKASEKMYSELGRIHKEKTRMLEQENRQMVVAVAGCVAQAEGKTIRSRAHYVDIVVGSQSYHRLPQMVANALDGKKAKKNINLDFSAEDKFDTLENAKATDVASSAFLTIQEGCDKFCTFCVVPYTRGAEYSRNVPEIYREAIRLVEAGAREIILLGQNVNAYHGSNGHGDVWNLGQLMEHLSNIDGLSRIRYTTSHPRDMHAKMLEQHRDNPKVMPYLHLPVQSGSDKILKAMNRKHTRDEYLQKIAEIRQYRPDIAISGDFIVGFPGETEQDFEDTLDLVRKVKYSQAYSFAYSERPGTPAANRDDMLPLEEKERRLAILQELLTEHQKEFNANTVGKKFSVLLEKKGRNIGQLVGKTPYQQSIHLLAPSNNIGDIVEVEVTGVKNFSLEGVII